MLKRIPVLKLLVWVLAACFMAAVALTDETAFSHEKLGKVIIGELVFNEVVLVYHRHEVWYQKNGEHVRVGHHEHTPKLYASVGGDHKNYRDPTFEETTLYLRLYGNPEKLND